MPTPGDENLRRIADLVEGRLEDSEFALLQDALASDAELRAVYVDLLQVEHDLRNQMPSPLLQLSQRSSPRRGAGRLLPWAIAASLLLGLAGWGYLSSRPGSPSDPGAVAAAPVREVMVAGHATLRQLVDARWSAGGQAFRVGDTLPNGLFALEEGLAEIDLFCGATLLVEGPARLELQSDWAVRCLEGRVRAIVPPAARGFVLKTADSEIIDLGTEFVLDVNQRSARVQVVDGKIKIRDGKQRERELLAGEGSVLRGASTEDFGSLGELVDVRELSSRAAAALRKRFEAWQKASAALRDDPRLIAYYPIANLPGHGRGIKNQAASGRPSDGTLVGLVDRVDGRFGAGSGALQFSRPGARVRVRVDGTYEAFTFVCWARIDSLAHRYNALFLGDGYETGEPHWQIESDGQLMFSVMVDDTRKRLIHSRLEGRTVTRAGRHYVYRSPPFWNPSLSGQWFHLAAVYDPATRRVSQYVNGERISEHEIEDKYFIDKLRIGPAEIGNWGRPFRDTPAFAIRNLNGAIDEFAIFRAPLSGEEIQALYQVGKPASY